MIKAVIFDYFGVIANGDYWDEFQAEAELKGLANDLENTMQAMDDGRLSWHGFCEAVAKQTSTTAAQVDQKCRELELNAPLIAYAHSLKDAGYKLGLLSNASSEYLLPILRESGLETLFDTVVISSDVGVSKPHPQIYKTALTKLNTDPHEAVFIDDIYANAAAAEAVGMYSVQFFSTIQTKRDIQKILAKA